MLLPKNCNNCFTDLVENDFYIDKIQKCECNNAYVVSISYKYDCKKCNFRSKWQTSNGVCSACTENQNSAKHADEQFDLGNFQKILNVSDMCFESYPCQHYINYIDFEGNKRSKLMTLPKIIELYNKLGIDFQNPHF